MGTISIPSQAEMDNGAILRVDVDQRELARAEAKGIDKSTRHTYVRFLVWAALVRTRQYMGPWEQFNETDCVEAIDDLAEVPAGDDSLDPGQTGRSAGT